MTVQSLDNTPAVLSVGKFREDHGYSVEWITGQQPQLTKNGNNITCKTYFRASCCTRTVNIFPANLEDLERHVLAYISKRERTRNRMQEKQDRMETEDPTQGIPDWLQEFTAIPEEVNSDSEVSAKVPDKSRFRNHSVLFILQRIDIATYALRTKITRSPCRRLHEETIPRAENFGDLKTADHKVVNEEGVSRNNHRYAVVVQDLATQWIQSFPCKT